MRIDGASETTVSDEAMSRWQTMRCSEHARGREQRDVRRQRDELGVVEMEEIVVERLLVVD